MDEPMPPLKESPIMLKDELRELADALSAEDCVICGKPKSRHSMTSGYGVCQIYPVFVSKRETFECLIGQARASIKGSSDETD